MVSDACDPSPSMGEAVGSQLNLTSELQVMTDHVSKEQDAIPENNAWVCLLVSTCMYTHIHPHIQQHSYIIEKARGRRA